MTYLNFSPSPRRRELMRKALASGRELEAAQLDVVEQQLDQEIEAEKQKLRGQMAGSSSPNSVAS